MKPAKYIKDDARKIDLGTKVIYKYPTPMDELDIGVMHVDGRHPEQDGVFIIEEACSFVMYILEGAGKVYVEDQVFDVAGEDVVFVPKNHRFAVSGGGLKYVTVDNPAFYPEQSKEVGDEAA